MMKYFRKGFHKVYVLRDACIIVASYFLAYYLRFYVLYNVHMDANEKWYSLKVYTDKLILIIPLYLFIYFLCGLYAPIENKFTLSKFLKTILANILGILLILFALYLQMEFDISRQFLLFFFASNVILSVGARELHSYGLKIMGKNQQTIS